MWIVAVGAALTAVATGLGALPLLVLRDVGPARRGIATSVAAGLMLAASIVLIEQGNERGGYRTIVGVVIGIALVVIGERLMPSPKSGEDDPPAPADIAVETAMPGAGARTPGAGAHAPAHAHGHAHGGSESLLASLATQASARRAFMLIAIMTVHSFAEGIGVGVSYGGGDRLGWFITGAIAIHNIPEGLAISLVLVPLGASVWRAAGWSIFSSLPQPLMAVPAFLFVEHFARVLPVGFGIAAGAMIWMILEELLPEALEWNHPRVVALVTTLSMAAMLFVQQLLLGV